MAIFQVINTADAGDTRYQGFVKDAENWSDLEVILSATTSKMLVGGGVGVAPVMTETTGTGAPVRADSPALITPTLGVAAATTINKVTITAPATGSTLTIVDGKVLTASSTLTLTATDGSTLAIGTGGTLGTAAYTAATAYATSTQGGKADTALQPGTAAVLGSNTFTGAQAYGDQQHSRAMFVDCGYTYLDKGNSSTTTQTLNYTAGSHQRVRATGDFTIATSNWPPSGNLGEILFELVGDGTARTITWPTVNWILPDGTTTTTFASNGVTLVTTDGASNFCVLWTRDAGTTIYGKFIR